MLRKKIVRLYCLYRQRIEADDRVRGVVRIKVAVVVVTIDMVDEIGRVRGIVAFVIDQVQGIVAIEIARVVATIGDQLLGKGDVHHQETDIVVTVDQRHAAETMQLDVERPREIEMAAKIGTQRELAVIEKDLHHWIKIVAKKEAQAKVVRAAAVVAAVVVEQVTVVKLEVVAVAVMVVAVVALVVEVAEVVAVVAVLLRALRQNRDLRHLRRIRRLLLLNKIKFRFIQIEE